MPIYTVKIDGKTYDIQGDRPPTEAEAREAVGTHQTAAPAQAAPEDDRGYLEQVKDRFVGGVGRAVKNPAVGAGLATAVAAPFTGGLSLIPAAASMFAAGTAGALPAAIAKGKPMQAPYEGALAATGEGAGRILSGTLRMAGRGMYRAAALPINKFNKYGDLIREGLENAVPVSKSGVKKAEGMLAERTATKVAALADADTRMGFRTKGITADAGMNLQREAAELRKAGYDDPTDMFDQRLAAYEQANGPGMTASEVEATKRTIDNKTGAAHKKIRMREELTPTEQYGVEMTAAQGRALTEAIPNYKALNKDKMNAEGLRQMIARRVDPNGSGGNQGLENALTMLGGVGAIPARLAMLPPVLSRGAIAAHKAGQSAVPTNAFRTALLALFGGDD